MPPLEHPSRLEFFACPTCKGFGYVLTPAKKHIECDLCHAHPSEYVLNGNQLLWWGRSVAKNGIMQRSLRQWFHLGFNALLLLCGAGGAAAVAYTVFTQIARQQPVVELFLTPNPLMAVFWFSVVLDLLLYYRLESETFSHRVLTDSKPLRTIKRPANLTFTTFHELHRHHANDISAFFTVECLKAIDGAYALAKKLGHHQVTPLHLLGASMDSAALSVTLARLGVSQKAVFEKIGKAMMLEGIDSGDGLDLNTAAYTMLFYAFEEAQQLQRKTVDVLELFLAIIHRDAWAQEIFLDLELDESIVRNCIEWIYVQRKLRDTYLEWKRKAAHKPKGIMDRAMTAQPSPLLQSLSQDYTMIASRGGFFPLIGRQSEMDQLLRIFGQNAGDVMLVGPSGVGKTTLFEGLAQLMASEDVPVYLQDKRLVILDPGALIAGASGIGTLEQRMQEIIHEMTKAGNIILGIEDVHHLLNMRSSGGSEDVAGILMNAMSQGQIRVVATTTTEEYQQFIESHAPFMRRFQVVRVDELSQDDAIKVLEAKTALLENQHKVFFSYAAVSSIVDFSVRFIQDRYLPSKALDIMAEVAGYVESRKGQGSFVTREDVAQVISEKTNVQVTALTENDRDKLLHLEELLHQRMVGQQEAVNAVASALRRSREGLRDTKRPIASLLFLGPTGVGKTEMAKTIAEVYFGDEKNMIRLDMSEYQDASALRKLIGGKGEKGLLTQAVREKPFSLVLLDELEKAHPEVLNIFLQVMDDGRLTDGTGKTVDMTNTMIVATSNAATQQIQNSIAAGLTPEQVKNLLLDEVLPKLFRPEFINRFDNVVVFTPLTFEEVVEVAAHLIEQLQRAMLANKGIAVEVTPEAVLELAQRGYSPQYGARPLRRVIQDTVDDGLAKLLLGQQLSRRDTVVLQAEGIMEVKKATGL